MRVDVGALLDPVVAALGEVYELFGRVHDVAAGVPLDLSRDPEQASFEVAALASLGPLDAQRVLELPHTEARLRVLRDLLADHAALLRGQLGS